jgi:integrase
MLGAILIKARARIEERIERALRPTDPICCYFRGYYPTEPLRWAQTSALRAWHRDLEQLGVPHPISGPRRLHSTRHTFITHLLRAGAQREAVKEITHTKGRARDAFDLYDHHIDWDSLCAAVARLEVVR